MRKMTVIALALAGAVAILHAVGLSGLIINNTGLTYNQRYSFNLSNAAVNTVSATAVYSSSTYASSSFTTGQISTGSFLVLSTTQMSSAAATNSITIASTAGALGDSIVIPYVTKPGAYVLTAGRDWLYKNTTTGTAISINTALNAVPWMSHAVVGSVIYATAPVGSLYNSVPMTTNNSTTLTISSPTFLGGRDAQILFVNGYSFKAGKDFVIGATPAATATAIKNAINAKAHLKTYVLAGTATSSVTVQGVLAGAYNFPLATSNTAGVSVLHPTMIGGTNPSWTLNSKNIIIANHGYPLALGVLYSSGSSSVISGLTNQTTYYVIPVDANTLQLASSSANAQAGTGIVLASSSTLSTAQTYSLAPLSFVAAAATGGKWQVSNDAVTWTDLNVATFSWIAGGGAGNTSWDFGAIGFKYLGLNVVAPSAGALNLQVTANGGYTP